MTKEIAVGYTDSAISGFTSLAPSLPCINWPVDFRQVSADSAELVLTNVTSPVDQAETFRFAQRKVSNVYAGTDIDPSAYLPNRQGTSTLIELRETWMETSTTDETYRKAIPVRVGISFTLPMYGNITAVQALGLVLRCAAAVFDYKTADSTGMVSILRGVLTKKSA